MTFLVEHSLCNLFKSKQLKLQGFEHIFKTILNTTSPEDLVLQNN